MSSNKYNINKSSRKLSSLSGENPTLPGINLSTPSHSEVKQGEVKESKTKITSTRATPQKDYWRKVKRNKSDRQYEESEDWVSDDGEKKQSQESVRPPYISEKHWNEWVIESGISKKITVLNCRSWDKNDVEAIFAILYPHATRKNSGVLTSGYLKLYRYLQKKTGWITTGVDPITGKNALQEFENRLPEYARVRFDNPDRNKYQTPQKQKGSTEIGYQLFFADVPADIWVDTAIYWGVRIEKSDRHYWEWVRNHPEIPIQLPEGEKKACSPISRLWPAIGLPGIWQGTVKVNEQIVLHPQLAKFCQLGRKFGVVFDSDTDSQILKRKATQADGIDPLDKAAGRLLRGLKNHYKVEAYRIYLPRPNPEKKVGLDDYLAAGGDYSMLWRQGIEGDDFLRQQLIDGQKRKYKNVYRFTPNLKVNAENLLEILDVVFPSVEAIKAGKAKAIAIRSPKNTRKTIAVIKWLQQVDFGCIDIGTTNSLLMQKDSKFTEFGLISAHIHDVTGLDRELIRDPKSCIHLCVNSLLKRKIHPENVIGKILFLDETTEILETLFTASTTLENRNEIIDNFVAMLRLAKFVVMAEAELSDWVVNFISKLGKFNPSQVRKVENEYLPPHRCIEIINGTKKGDKENPWDYRANLLNAIDMMTGALLHGDETVVLLSDSKKFCHAVEKMLLNAEDNIASVSAQKVKKSKILVVTRDTKHKPEVISFLSNPTKYLKDNAIKILIYSPTLSSGVSINNLIFFGIIFGFRFHIGTQKFTQMLGRVRDENVPASIWSVPYLISEDSVKFSAKNILSDESVRILSEAETLSYSPQLTQAIAELRNQYDYYQIVNEFTAEILWLQDFDRTNLKANLLEHFAEVGAEVTETWVERDSSIKEIGDRYQKAKDEWCLEVGEHIFNAENIDIEKAREIIRSQTTRTEDIAAARKAMLINRVPGIDESAEWSPELIALLLEQEPAAISKLEHRYRLFNIGNAEELRKYEIEDCFDLILNPEKLKEFPLLSRDFKTHYWRDRTAINAGILNIFEKREWAPDDPLLIEIAKKLSHKSRSWLAGKMGKGGAIKLINRILRSVGFQLERKQKKVGGKVQSYCLLQDKLERVSLANRQFNLAGFLADLIYKKNENKLMWKKESKAPPDFSCNNSEMQSEQKVTDDPQKTIENPPHLLPPQTQTNQDIDAPKFEVQSELSSEESVEEAKTQTNQAVDADKPPESLISLLEIDFFPPMDEIENEKDEEVWQLADDIEIGLNFEDAYIEVQKFSNRIILENGGPFKSFGERMLIYIRKPNGGLLTIPFDWLQPRPINSA